MIFLVTPVRARAAWGDAKVRIVNPSAAKFFGFEPVDVLGYKVMLSDREKTAIDCVDRPALAGGVGEAATILANASRRIDWKKVADYLQQLESGALVRRFGLARRSRQSRYAVRRARTPAQRYRTEHPGMTRSRSRARGAARHRL
jgi:predicted transcriptional regulator of viral defense system